MSLTFTPLLVLACDQKAKLNKKIRNIREKNVFVYHLDEIEGTPILRPLLKSLRKLEPNTTGTIFLFASPRIVLKNEEVKNTVHHLLRKKILRLISYDEIHLFHHYGRSFRSEFANIHEIFPTKERQLLMTATCNNAILNSCELLFNNTISHRVWGNNIDQEMRTVSFEIYYNTKPNYAVFDKIVEKLSIDNNSKVIVYANTRTRVDEFEIYSENKFDAIGTEENKLHTIDVVKVYGPLTVEEKGDNLFTFMNKSTANYNPRVLVATSGASNAGIDSDSIYGVYRLDMPPNRIDIVQERGRAGRFEDATPQQCHYCVYFSISTFEYKLIQINSKKEKVIDETYREEMEDELLETLKLLIISHKCISQSLEVMLSNPHEDINIEYSNRCDHCFVCKRSIIGRKFKKVELTALLFGIFSDPEILKNNLTSDLITKVIRSKKECCKSVFNVTNLKVSDIEATLLVLIAAGLVGWSIEKDEKGKEFVTLNLLKEKSKFKIQIDDAWSVIPERYFH